MVFRAVLLSELLSITWWIIFQRMDKQRVLFNDGFIYHARSIFHNVYRLSISQLRIHLMRIWYNSSDLDACLF